MQFSEHDLRAAVTAGALDTNALSRLLDFLATRQSSVPSVAAAPAPQFDLAHLLWYAGALIVMGAMGLFSTLAFSSMGGGALTATAIVYAILFTIAGHHLWYVRNLRIPGGLLIADRGLDGAARGLRHPGSLGLWGQFGRPGTVHDFYVWIKGSWVFMEVAAIVAAVIALRFYPFPFIVMIIAFALWFMSMDLTPWIFGRSEFTWEERRAVSMWFGLGVLVVAWAVDHRPRGGDFAFWLHLFGMMTFWGGLSMKSSDSEIAKALYCLLNVGLVLLSVVSEAAGLCGVRHARCRRLSRLSLPLGVQGLDAVPLRAVGDRRRRHRGRAVLSQASGRGCGLAGPASARGGVVPAARGRQVIIPNDVMAAAQRARRPSCLVRFASGFATSRAASIKSCAAGLSALFFKVTMPIGPLATGKSTGNFLMNGCGSGSSARNQERSRDSGLSLEDWHAFERRRDHGRARKIEPGGPKDLDDNDPNASSGGGSAHGSSIKSASAMRRRLSQGLFAPAATT